jgi:hypothetical protein
MMRSTIDSNFPCSKMHPEVGKQDVLHKLLAWVGAWILEWSYAPHSLEFLGPFITMLTKAMVKIDYFISL